MSRTEMVYTLPPPPSRQPDRQLSQAKLTSLLIDHAYCWSCCQLNNPSLPVSPTGQARHYVAQAMKGGNMGVVAVAIE